MGTGVKKGSELGADGARDSLPAGADIKEMKDKNFSDAYKSNFLGSWIRVTNMRKPIIGAVSGYAVSPARGSRSCPRAHTHPRSLPRAQLGGGCELAMMCDILLASPTAQFGQPEITLGIIPGAGGTQRLTKIVGKPVAMDMVLTGRRINADEAEKYGLVSRVVREGSVIDEAVKVGEKISSFGRVAVQAGKEAVNAGESGRPVVTSHPALTLTMRITLPLPSQRAPAHRGPPPRAPSLPAALCDAGSKGGHGRVRREAQAQLFAPLGLGCGSERSYKMHVVDDARTRCRPLTAYSWGRAQHRPDARASSPEAASRAAERFATTTPAAPIASHLATRDARIACTRFRVPISTGSGNDGSEAARSAAQRVMAVDA